MVEVTALGKSYGSVRALDGVRFSIAAGEIVGLLGPNGAGKTTVLKILTGYLQPDHGTVTVDGLDVLTDALAVQQRIGYLPENAPLYPELTVQSYLRHVAELRRLSAEEGRARIAEALAKTGLLDQMTRPIGELSKGYRQRVGLAQAILHQPRLLILDEPSVGLDPTQIVQMRRLIRELARRSTVLFSTHILSEVEALCDRAVIIMQGRIRADADLETLAAGTAVLLTLAHEMPAVRERLLAIPGVQAVERERDERDERGVRYRITAGAPVDALSRAVFDAAAAGRWPVSELRHERRTLEMVFDALASGAGNGSADGGAADSDAAHSDAAHSDAAGSDVAGTGADDEGTA